MPTLASCPAELPSMISNSREKLKAGSDLNLSSNQNDFRSKTNHKKRTSLSPADTLIHISLLLSLLLTEIILGIMSGYCIGNLLVKPYAEKVINEVADETVRQLLEP